MKVIFLDIDWVLIRFWNTEKIRKTRAEKWDKWWLITSLDKDLVFNLIKIIQETNAFIVLSSSWRRNSFLLEELEEQFYNYFEANPLLAVNLWERIIWKTPFELWYWRWNEILTWLNDYHKTCKNWYHITNWIAIDDDSFDMKSIKRLWRFIHTKTSEWLTEEKMNEAINILNNI